MKILKLFPTLFFVLILTACSSIKKATNSEFYNTNWELEYLSGPRIAFAGLFPDKKPTISFNQETKRVTGSDSCNGYSADFKLSTDEISFENPGPSTMMYCGEGEKFFLSTIKKVNKYKIDSEGKLNLMIGGVSMMRFKKTGK